MTAWLSLFLVGCTASYIPETDLEVVKSEDLDTAYWWRIKFRIHWPEGEAPDFSLHSLIADQIVAPVLESRGEAMALWRFHRRSKRDDAAGHQFSFIYYANRDTANTVNQAISNNSVTVDLLDSGILDRVIYNGEGDQQKTVEATSDGKWPVEIQKSWPSYIMGVSATWLGLIQQFKVDSPPPQDADIHELRRYYMTLNARITDQWGLYGRHAYLHHLNAVFGYEPVYIQQTDTWEKF